MNNNLEYTEIQPQEKLAKYVHKYWTLKGEKHSYRQLLLGDAQTKIIISKKANINCRTKFNIYHKKDKHNHLDEITESENIHKIESSAVIIGPGMDYSLLCIDGELDIFVIEFTEIGASIILNESMQDFAFKCVPSSQCNNKVVRNIEEMLTKTFCQDTIDNYLSEQIKSTQRDIDNIDLINKITDNFDCNSRLTQISEYACVCERQLRRIFKKYVGITLNEILRIYRAQVAFKSILSSGNNNINTTGFYDDEINFADESHFIKEFNRYCGHTPTALIEHSRKILWNKNVAFFESRNKRYNICRI